MSAFESQKASEDDRQKLLDATAWRAAHECCCSSRAGEGSAMARGPLLEAAAPSALGVGSTAIDAGVMWLIALERPKSRPVPPM